MPELPEVETIVRDLQALRHDELREIKIHDPRVWFESDLSSKYFQNIRLAKIERRGKYIVWDFCDRFLVQHLRMTGKMLPEDSPALPQKIKGNKQIRLELDFAKGKKFFFYDTRRFGTFTSVANLGDFWKRKRQAPDPLNPGEAEMAKAYFIEHISGRARPIKSALLDQTIISGVGNIYADEALHREKIHPLTPAKKISPVALARLFDTLREIFLAAIAARGTSAFNYLGVNGQPGSFAKFLKTYQRTDESCLTCGKAKIIAIKIGGRSSHFCPICQKK